MKVLFVTRGFPSDKNIMDGNYEAVQAKAIAAKGCKVSVITIRKKSIQNVFKWGQITHRVVDNVDVYEGIYICNHIRLIRRLNEHLRKWAYRQAFKRYVKYNGLPDIVHCHIISTASLALFYKEDYHIPFVITEHWTKINVPDIPKWLQKMSYTYHRADQVICVSQALADSLKRNLQVDSIVINNMVSDQFFQSSKVNRNDDQFRFIAIGAFRENKGFDILVDAFAEAKFSDNVTLSIVGDGEEREHVENKINEHGLFNQIHLLGVKTPEEVNNLLSQSDCFVLSSRLETFAIVVIEAMAKGLPVIATRSGGPETFLQPEHGILVEKENVRELADAMKYMTEHYKDYNSDNIREYCYSHFSQDIIADKIIEVYNQVINQNQKVK